jgi:hypothetical protein
VKSHGGRKDGRSRLRVLRIGRANREQLCLRVIESARICTHLGDNNFARQVLINCLQGQVMRFASLGRSADLSV